MEADNVVAYKIARLDRRRAALQIPVGGIE
jgi:hypothetical protein